MLFLCIHKIKDELKLKIKKFNPRERDFMKEKPTEQTWKNIKMEYIKWEMWHKQKLNI